MGIYNIACLISNFIDCNICVSHYCASDKIEKNDMGGACSVYGGGERRGQGFGVET
jgi:hypothetical protein